MANYYDTLGVDYDADAATIRKAYQERTRALQDSRQRADVDVARPVVVRMQELNTAHEVLSDTSRRRDYDQFLADHALDEADGPPAPVRPPPARPVRPGPARTWRGAASALPAPLTARQARADAKAASARAKALRPRYRRGSAWLLFLVAGVLVVAGVAGIGAAKKTPTTTISPPTGAEADQPNPRALYPNRRDVQSTDHEQVVGLKPIRFAGYSVYVESVQYERQVGVFCCGFARLHVEVLNRDQGQQQWYRDDFSIVRPTGEVYDPTFTNVSELGINGSLVHGGSVTGDLYFSVDPRVHGRYYVYWEPSFDPSNSDRGVWSFVF